MEEERFTFRAASIRGIDHTASIRAIQPALDSSTDSIHKDNQEEAVQLALWCRAFLTEETVQALKKRL
jgi:hypothetical protein